jgi:peptidoglycan/LPS O-acetylase OafA/YrhL
VSSGAYRQDIDGLRAVAVVPVVLFHAGIAPFGGGFVGVDVFFVISGYLITRILVAENTVEGYFPRFNALNVFDVGVPLLVSYVAPFAQAPRLSIAGWLPGR